MIATLAHSPLQDAVGWTVDVGIVVIMLGMVLCLYRLVRGPHLADRAVAIDTLSVQLIGMVVLLSIRIDTQTYFDGILILALLGFAGTVAMAQYIARPHIRRAAATTPPEETTP